MKTTTTKAIAANILIDTTTAVKLLETTGRGTYGIYKARQVRNGVTTDDWQVYLETNGDPAILPHADYPEELAAVLQDAEVSQEELEAALGVRWADWCN